MTHADFAATEFKRRHSIAQQSCDARRWSAGQATEALRPWLAIAAAAGADLPELLDEQRVIYPRERAGQTISVRIKSDELCPRDRWHAELTRARDAALDKGTDPARTRNLAGLCSALGIDIPYRPSAAEPERKAA